MDTSIILDTVSKRYSATVHFFWHSDFREWDSTGRKRKKAYFLAAAPVGLNLLNVLKEDLSLIIIITGTRDWLDFWLCFADGGSEWLLSAHSLSSCEPWHLACCCHCVTTGRSVRSERLKVIICPVRSGRRMHETKFSFLFFAIWSGLVFFIRQPPICFRSGGLTELKWSKVKLLLLRPKNSLLFLLHSLHSLKLNLCAVHQTEEESY